MHLRSGKALKIMTKSANTGVLCHHNHHNLLHKHKLHGHPPLQCASVSTAVGATMAMPVSTEMGVTAPIVTAQMTQPEIGTFVPPFTAGVPVSTNVPTSNPKVRA
jgi:hypothetical protein